MISLLWSISSIYILISLLDKKSVKLHTRLLSILLLTVIVFTIKLCLGNNNYANTLNFITLFIIMNFLFPDNYSNNFISIIVLFIINMISEIIITAILLFLNIDFLNASQTLYLIINVIILILSILIINLPIIKRQKNIFFKDVDKYKYPFILIVLLTLLFLVIKSFSISNKALLTISIFSILITIILLVNIIFEEIKIKKITDQYDEMIKITGNYEKIINKRMKMTHEYNNQLLLIKSMISDKDKKLHSYIDELLKHSNANIDNHIVCELQKIPFKELNGMLYYKINEANEKKIKIELDISNELKKIKGIKENDIMDITKLIGIFMDNAIDALNKKEKQISISIYHNNSKLVVSIANNFEGTIDLENMKSTKGPEHGYGLLIAKDIIDKNPRIKNETECISNVFIQNIFLDLKK